MGIVKSNLVNQLSDNYPNILKKDINKIGSYTIDINLFAEVSAKVKLIVKKTETK